MIGCHPNCKYHRWGQIAHHDKACVIQATGREAVAGRQCVLTFEILRTSGDDPKRTAGDTQWPKANSREYSLAGSQAIRQLYRCDFTDECKGTGTAEWRWGSLGCGGPWTLKANQPRLPLKQISTGGGSYHFALEILPLMFTTDIDLYFFLFTMTLFGFASKVIHAS